MNQLNEALKLVEEVEQQEIESPREIDQATAATDLPPPSEPPMDDAAVGADTEANVVLGLLADIRDLLTQLTNPEGADLDVEGEGPGGPGGDELPLPGEGEEGEEGPVDAIPEAPEDEDDEEDHKSFANPGKKSAPDGE